MQFTEPSAKLSHFFPMIYLTTQGEKQSYLFSVDELFPGGAITNSKKNSETL